MLFPKQRAYLPRQPPRLGNLREQTHLVSRIPVDNGACLGKNRGLEGVKRAHRCPRFREDELRALLFLNGRTCIQNPVDFRPFDVADVDREVRSALDVVDHRLWIGLGAEVRRGQRRGERRLRFMQSEEDDRRAAQPGSLEGLHAWVRGLAFALALREERFGAQKGADVGGRQASEGLLERACVRIGGGGLEERPALAEDEPPRCWCVYDGVEEGL